MMWHKEGDRLEWHGPQFAAWAEGRKKRGVDLHREDPDDLRPPVLAEVCYERGRWYCATIGELVYDGGRWMVPTYDTQAEAIGALGTKLGKKLPKVP